MNSHQTGSYLNCDDGECRDGQEPADDRQKDDIRQAHVGIHNSLIRPNSMTKSDFSPCRTVMGGSKATVVVKFNRLYGRKLAKAVSTAR